MKYLDIKTDSSQFYKIHKLIWPCTESFYLDMKYYVKRFKDLTGGLRLPSRYRPTPDSGSATHAWLILWKAARAVEQNAARSVSAIGLGLSDFAVLELLLHKGSQPVSVIGKKVLLTSGSITAAVDRLESKKLVRRNADPADLRSRIVQLTAKGETLIEKAFEQHAIDVEETMAVLKPRERAELTRLLKKLGMWAALRLES